MPGFSEASVGYAVYVIYIHKARVAITPITAASENISSRSLLVRDMYLA